MPRTFLSVTKIVGQVPENITRVELDGGVSAGIRWQSLSPELVPIYEEQAARLEKNISLEAWGNMSPVEKAIVIAVRRIDNAAKNLHAEAESKAVKNRPPKGKR